MGSDGMSEGPKKSRDVGVAAGFNRMGNPNVKRQDKLLNDPNTPLEDAKAFIEVATDTQRGAELTIQDNPSWGVRQDEVDKAKGVFLERGRRNGLKALEADLETAMRNTNGDRGATINNLALSLAYLELEAHTDENTPDLKDRV